MNEFYADESGIHGFGCFTRVDIKAGERFIVNVLPVAKPHNLDHCFPFSFTESCIVLSPFSYCNNSQKPNFRVKHMNFVAREFTFEAITDIPAYTEITLSYNGG
jgi:hypothetical protein